MHDIRFTLQRGKILGLVGTSCAGKSTLALSLLKLLPWHGGRVTGEVILDDRNLLALSERSRKLRGSSVTFIPQSPMTALNGAITLLPHFSEARKEDEDTGCEALMARIVFLLGEVQLPTDADFLRKRPPQISVGQAQRLLNALALLRQPALIIADEPTSAIDPITQTQIIDLLKRLNRGQGTTILYISYDLVCVLQLCDHVSVLDRGTIVESLPVNRAGDARHPATIAVLNSLPAQPMSCLASATAKSRKSTLPARTSIEPLKAKIADKNAGVLCRPSLLASCCVSVDTLIFHSRQVCARGFICGCRTKLTDTDATESSDKLMDDRRAILVQG